MSILRLALFVFAFTCGLAACHYLMPGTPQAHGKNIKRLQIEPAHALPQTRGSKKGVPFPNATEQRRALLQELKAIHKLLEEQNKLLKEGK